MRQFLRYFTISTLIFLCGCTDVPQGENFVIPKDKGAVSLKLAASAVKTRATATDFIKPAADEFNITFVNEALDTVFQQPFTEFPYALVLPAGNYKALAQYGQDLPFSTTVPYYRSEQNFAVEMGQTTYIDMKAVLNSFVVQINYSADFGDYFSTYSVVGEVEGGHTYTFAQDASGYAYFAPCAIRLVLKGTLIDGSPYSSIIQEFTSTGTELHKLNIKVLPRGHNFAIDIDKSVTIVDITSTVPDEFLPDMPLVSPLTISTYETEAIAHGVNTSLPLSSILKLTDVYFAPDAKLKTLFSITQDTLKASVAEDVAILTGMGINTAGLIGVQSGSVDFKQLAQSLLTQGGVATDFTMGVKTVDYFGKSSTGNVTLTVNAPVFTMAEITAGNVWSREFAFSPISSQDNITHGNYAKMAELGGFKYQFSANGVDWTDIAQGVHRVDNLASSVNGTLYYMRAIYRGVPSAAREVTTTPTTPIPYGDLDNWTSNNSPACYFVGDGSVWATRNIHTTNRGGNYWYTSSSGTRPDDNSYDGQGAYLVTTGWGSANTWAGYLWSAAIYNTTVGSLFLGSCTDRDNITEVHGYPFTSRPTSFTFYYKYAPHKGDEMRVWVQVENRSNGTTTVLATNEFKTVDGSGNFAPKTMALNYINTELPATHICIAFYSGKNEGSKNYLYDNTDSYGSRHLYGSRLYVDKLSLSYEK